MAYIGSRLELTVCLFKCCVPMLVSGFKKYSKILVFSTNFIGCLQQQQTQGK